MPIIKKLLFILLFIVITAGATETKVFVEIKDNAHDITTHEGRLYYGSYLYAMVSASSVHTDIYFHGDPEVAMDIFTQVADSDTDSNFHLQSIDYNIVNKYIVAILIDGYCINFWNDQASCSYPVIISKK